MYYNETIGSFVLGFTNTNGNIINVQDGNLRIANLNITSTSGSNSSIGNLSMIGTISINNTTGSSSCTQGGTITSLGGIAAKDMHLNNYIAIGPIINPNEMINAKGTSATLCLEHSTTTGSSFIDLVSNTSNRYGILFDGYSQQLSLTNSTTNQTPNLSNKILTINTSGNIGINTTNANTLITLLPNNYISADTTSGYLGLTGSNDISSSKIKLFGNGATGSNGNISLYSSSIGNISFYTDIQQMQINNSGIKIYNTSSSINSSTASTVIDGGVSIMNSTNATSYTSGGGITIAGGASIYKDLWVNGNLHINGIIAASGSSSQPIISTSDTINCTVSTYYSSNLLNINAYGIFTVAFEIIPTVAFSNTQFQFAIPSRSTNFINNFDIVSTISGFSDQMTPLFNTLTVGNPGTTNLIVKFQSNSTSTHYIQITCNYNII